MRNALTTMDVCDFVRDWLEHAILPILPQRGRVSRPTVCDSSQKRRSNSLC